MQRQSLDGLVFYQFDGLAHYSDLYHGAFTRLGGVSRAPFESLNLARSVGDDAQIVQENNRRMLRAFGMTPDRATTAWLVHGKAVAVMTHADAGNYRQGFDAIITRERGLALTMRFADCVPIVLFDPVQRAIGLAHAGWRGVAENVVAATVAALRDNFGSQPHDLWTGIGPCISVDRYRVGSEVIDRVTPACPPHTPIVQRQPDGSLHLDLNAAVAAQLRACGVESIEDSAICTASNTAEWFSHRAENGKTGRFGVVIGLR
ncbi:MAG TPA: peptidoglycan editing factor PgeF [Anaerolineae bacterium]|nr:peptidoglycan editing factor PgeF [Anaerolineae bacterium]